jgi:hypothetical protein
MRRNRLAFLLIVTIISLVFSVQAAYAMEENGWVSKIQAGYRGIYILKINGDLFFAKANDKLQLKKVSGSISDFVVFGDDNIRAVKDDGRLLVGTSDGLYHDDGIPKKIGLAKKVVRGSYVINTNNELWEINNNNATKVADDVADSRYFNKNLIVLKTNGELWGDSLITSNVKGIEKAYVNSLYVIKGNGQLLFYNLNDKKFTEVSDNVVDITTNDSLTDSNSLTIFKLDNTGQLYGRGFNEDGRIGNDSHKFTKDWTAVLDHVQFVATSYAVAGSAEFAIALRKNGELWGWGTDFRSDVPKLILNPQNSGIIKATGEYKNASEWALPELEKAEAKGLLDSIMSLNFDENITREQFCEVVVKYYETLSGKPLSVTVKNPFIDTSNTEVLKAYEKGIVQGTSADKFSPNSGITREEMVVMLKRALDKAKPKYKHNYSYKRLEDETAVSPWALDAVKFLRSMEIIKGDTDNNFNPKDKTTVESASIMVYRLLYETE